MLGGLSLAESGGWFVDSALYPVRPGNSVQPLVDGEPAFQRVCEVIETARFSVWVTVTFLWDGFEMPGGRGSFFEVLGRAAGRGLDVRVIFWRPDEEWAQLRQNAFWGSAQHFDQLDAARSRILVRWDKSPSGFCQHQKTWLVDAGHDEAVGIVGGINLNPHSVVAPGHHGQGHNHDAYVEIAGPSTMDIHHNFVQRWNDASERSRSDGLWGAAAAASLPTTRFPPKTWLEEFNALAACENVTLAGLAGIGADGGRTGVYIHSKLMLVDDQWATIGSCNLHAASLFYNAELNASWWDPVIVRQLRCQLFAEHLGETTEHLDPATAHRRFGRLARGNRARWAASETWSGLAFRLDAAVYAQRRFAAV